MLSPIAASPVVQQRKAIILPGNKCVWTGDSLTATYSWFQAIADAANTSFAANGRAVATHLNRGVSGTGVTASASAGDLNTLMLPTIVADAADFVCILVGRNDAFGGATAPAFQAGLLSYASGMLTVKLPAKQILIVSCWINGDPTGAIDALMDSYVVSARTVAAQLGCPFVDVRTERPTDGGYTVGDGIHPNDPKGKPYLCGRAVAGVTGVIV